MNRRDTLKHLATTLAAVPLNNISPFLNFEHMTASIDESVLTHLDPLRTEAPCRSEIRMERGGARLFLNGKEKSPFFAVAAQSTPDGKELSGSRYALSASIDRS